MTSEVCLLNRYGAVLAADSATTTSHWDEESQKTVERYFKGANKVFQLSAYHPVGMMIYSSASLHSVPWEVLVKEFRSDLKERAFPTVKEYAEAFFAFLKSNSWLFEPGIIESNFVYNASVSALSILWDAEKHPSVTGAASDADKTAAVRSIFAHRVAQSAALPLAPIFDPKEIAAAIASSGPDVASNLKPYLAQWTVPNDLTAIELANFGIEGVFKTFRQSLSNHHTGIVVAGFGEKQVFPSFMEYDCYGFILSTLAVQEGDNGSVSHLYPAHMRAYAQRSMVDTLRMGLSSDVLNSVYGNLTNALTQFAADVQVAMGGTAIPGIDALKTKVVDDFFNGLQNYSQKAHRDPLFRVIGHLPVPEMAQLAETLISLQSLKERVTRPSESVGGPVDVAVISRAEGLVWVKRKHYFDAGLNPRFFARLQGTH